MTFSVAVKLKRIFIREYLLVIILIILIYYFTNYLLTFLYVHISYNIKKHIRIPRQIIKKMIQLFSTCKYTNGQANRETFPFIIRKDVTTRTVKRFRIYIFCCIDTLQNIRIMCFMMSIDQPKNTNDHQVVKRPSLVTAVLQDCVNSNKYALIVLNTARIPESI